MVKKIEGGKRGIGSTYGVDPTKPVSGGDSAKSVEKTRGVERAGQVSNIKGTSATNALNKVGAAEIKITAENRAQLNRIVAEEADRLFSKKLLPEKDREVLEKAIKMALDGSVIDEE